MWKIVLVKEQDRGLIVGGGGNKFSSQLKQNNLLSRLHVLFFRVCSSLCMFIVCVCVRCIGIWWGFRTLRFALQRTPLPPPPPPPPPQKAVYEVSWELILTKTRAGTAARGAVCLNPAQARPPSETLCIYWNIYIYIYIFGVEGKCCLWNQPVSSAKCFSLCTLFSWAWLWWRAGHQMETKKVNLCFIDWFLCMCVLNSSFFFCFSKSCAPSECLYYFSILSFSLHK